MVNEAEANASADSERREAIEKKNQLDSLIYQAEKMLADNAEKVEEADKAALEGALTEAKADLESGDSAKLDASRQRVEAELHKIAEKLYKAEAEGAAGEGPANAGAGSTGETSGDDDVIDAEFTQESDDS